eukprot:1000027-Pyramimonas_sp.AAC.1
MTQPDLDKYSETGMKIYRTTVKAGEILFVPAGWLIASKATTPLNYGVRKSVFFQNSSDKREYFKAKSLLASSGHDTSKMDQIYNLFS